MTDFNPYDVVSPWPVAQERGDCTEFCDIARKIFGGSLPWFDVDTAPLLISVDAAPRLIAIYETADRSVSR